MEHQGLQVLCPWASPSSQAAAPWKFLILMQLNSAHLPAGAAGTGHLQVLGICHAALWPCAVLHMWEPALQRGAQALGATVHTSKVGANSGGLLSQVGTTTFTWTLLTPDLVPCPAQKGPQDMRPPVEAPISRALPAGCQEASFTRVRGAGPEQPQWGVGLQASPGPGLASEWMLGAGHAPTLTTSGAPAGLTGAANRLRKAGTLSLCPSEILHLYFKIVNDSKINILRVLATI